MLEIRVSLQLSMASTHFDRLIWCRSLNETKTKKLWNFFLFLSENNLRSIFEIQIWLRNYSNSVINFFNGTWDFADEFNSIMPSNNTLFAFILVFFVSVCLSLSNWCYFCFRPFTALTHNQCVLYSLFSRFNVHNLNEQKILKAR